MSFSIFTQSHAKRLVSKPMLRFASEQDYRAFLAARIPSRKSPNKAQGRTISPQSKGKGSQLEDRLFLALLEAGLPLPERQVRFAPPRRWRADFCWEREKLICEVQGGTWAFGRHSRGKGYEQDCLKFAEALILGYRVLPVTGDMVKDGRALELIRRALG